MAAVRATKHPLRHAVYVLTAADDSQLPPAGPPEVAFAGRSNAGKSSAINALANQTRLAYTSKTPGRTQQINLFRLRSGALLADLPGYGYAAVPRQLKRHWQAFLTHYLATRQSLVGLVLVVDARHGLAEADLALLAGFVPSGRPVLVLATKMDKLAPSAQRLAQAGIARALAGAFPAYAANVVVVSFSATRKSGVGDAETIIARWVGEVAEVGEVSEGEMAASPGVAQKEKAPRSRGVTGGPKRLAYGVSRTKAPAQGGKRGTR